MTYRTIIAHLNDERRAAQVIDVAAGIADRHEAHLVGLYVVPSGIFGSPTGIGGRMIESGRQAFRDEAKRIGDMFEAAVKGRPLVPEWRVVEPPRDHPGPFEAVLEQGRGADLVVTGQTDPSWEYHMLLDFPERLAMESGRPTIIVPFAGRFPRCGTRVLVAWNGKREAVRALYDAMPLLEKAEEVRVLSVDPKDAATEGIGGSLGGIGTVLARHGVKCEISRSVTAGVEVGDDLLNRASDFGADLIVMGCYGHSRLREFILGGASRTILRHMTVPVLMSH